MPPRIVVTEEKILNTAKELVREHGLAALNARSLADALGCSVQPIFRAFSSMGELKERLTAAVMEEYVAYLKKGMAGEEPLLGLLSAYIRYARQEREFFKLLQMSDRIDLHAVGEFTGVGINKLIADAMAEDSGLPDEDAQTLYAGTFFAAHGVASLIATNHCSFSEEEIQSIITDVYNGLVDQLKKKRNGGA